MKKLSIICQQYLDGELTMDRFVEDVRDVVDNMAQQDLHTFATFIVGGEFNEEG
jgi:hypothetical protein